MQLISFDNNPVICKYFTYIDGSYIIPLSISVTVCYRWIAFIRNLEIMLVWSSAILIITVSGMYPSMMAAHLSIQTSLNGWPVSAHLMDSCKWAREALLLLNWWDVSRKDLQKKNVCIILNMISLKINYLVFFPAFFAFQNASVAYHF